jgi:hypothetical protein
MKKNDTGRAPHTYGGKRKFGGYLVGKIWRKETTWKMLKTVFKQKG